MCTATLRGAAMKVAARRPLHLPARRRPLIRFVIEEQFAVPHIQLTNLAAVLMKMRLAAPTNRLAALQALSAKTLVPTAQLARH